MGSPRVQRHVCVEINKMHSIFSKQKVSTESRASLALHGPDYHLERIVRFDGLFPLVCGCEMWLTDIRALDTQLPPTKV